MQGQSPIVVWPRSVALLQDIIVVSFVETHPIFGVLAPSVFELPASQLAIALAATADNQMALNLA